MVTSLIGLGSNIGDRAASLERAVRDVTAHAGVRLIGLSRWYETRPIGGPAGQGRFFNGAMLLETSLAPEALLRLLKEAEQRAGRRSAVRWAARPADLDLLLYNGLTLASPDLVVPHPRMAFRRFVLEPAAEIAGWMVHPGTGWSVSRLLEHVKSARRYVSLTGPPGAGKTWLARRLAARFGGRGLEVPLESCERRDRRGRADRTGPDERREIGFVECRMRALESALSAADLPVAGPPGGRPGRHGMGGKPLLVSDFWLGQSLAYARLFCLPEQPVESAYRRAESAVGVPRLTVLLEGPYARLAARYRTRAIAPRWRLTPDEHRRVAAAIQRQVASPGGGPTLVWNGVRLCHALTEAAAAWEAMDEAGTVLA